MHYTNDFTYGKSMLKKIIIAAVIACGACFITQNSAPQISFACGVVTVALFIGAIVTVYKYCRCPHCGKVIFLGVLAVTSCPKCKRNLVTGKKTKKTKR